MDCRGLGLVVEAWALVCGPSCPSSGFSGASNRPQALCCSLLHCTCARDASSHFTRDNAAALGALCAAALFRAATSARPRPSDLDLLPRGSASSWCYGHWAD